MEGEHADEGSSAVMCCVFVCVAVWLCTFDGLLQVLQVELKLTDQTFFKLSELLSLLLHLHNKQTQEITNTL